MAYQRIGATGSKSPANEKRDSPFAPRPFAPPRATAAPPAHLQRLPSNNNDPTLQADGTYWDRRDQSAVRPENVKERVTAIMKDANNGGAPSVSPPGWAWLQNKVGKLKGKWVRFHIINQYLGGPGNASWNLVPTTVAVNNAFNRDIEEDAKDSANTQHQWTYLDVQLTYDNTWPAPVPTTVTAEWGTWDNVNGQWEMQDSLANALVNQDITALGAFYNYMRGVNITQAQVKRRGVPAQYLAAFTTWLQNYRQNDDDDDDMIEAAEANLTFGHDFDTTWVHQIWLDEVAANPGQYQPVLKAL